MYGHAPIQLPSDGVATFSADDRWLAVGDDSGLVRVLDATQGTPLAALRSHEAAITLLVAAPSGALLSGDTAGELALWSPGTHGWLDARPALLASRHRAAITSAAFSADGGVMVTADRDGNALAWDMSGPRVTRQLDESEDSGDGVVVGRGAASRYAVSADGKRALGWGSSFVFVMSLADGKRRPSRRVRGAVVGVEAEGDGFAVTTRDRFGSTVRETLDRDGRPSARVTVGAPAEEPVGTTARLRRSPRGYEIVTAAPADAPLSIELDAADERLLVVSRSGKRALLAAADTVALVDLDARAVHVERRSSVDLLWPQFVARLGAELVVADGNQLHFFDADSGRARGHIPLPADRLWVSQDGKRLAGLGSALFVLDATSREILFETAGSAPSTLAPGLDAWARVVERAIVVSPIPATTAPVQRAAAATSSPPRETRIELGEWHPTLLAFSPDGATLLVADSSGRAERIRVSDGQRVAKRDAGRRIEKIVDWSPDGIFAEAKTAGRATLLLKLDPASLEPLDESRAGAAVARSKDGTWLAWRGREQVMVRRGDGLTFRLPERLGQGTVIAFDPDGQSLYVGRVGAVERWALSELVASQTGVATRETKPVVAPEPGPPGRDSFGDPLPPRALRRFGTLHGLFDREIEDVITIGPHVWLIGSWGRAALWDVERGEATRRIESEGTAGDRNTFVTPDERWIVSRGTLSLGVWSVATGEQTAKVERPDAKDEASALSPRGDRLVVGTELGELRIYEVPNLELAHAESHAHKGRIEAVAFAPDGKLFASCGRFGVIRLDDPATGRNVRTILGRDQDEYAGCNAAAFSVDGGTLYANLGGLRAFDVASGRDLGELVGAQGNVSQIVVSPDGSSVAVGAHHDRAAVWDARTRALIATIETPDGASALAFSSDGKELYVGGQEGVLRRFDTRSWKEVAPRPVHGPLESLVLVDDGRTLVTADRSGQLRSWDASSAAAVGSRVVHDYPSLVGTERGLLAQTEGVRPIDPRSLRDLAPPVQTSGGRLAASRDGAVVALVDGHRLDLVDWATSQVRPIEWGGGYVDAVAVERSGRFIAAGGTSGAIRLFDRAGLEVGGGRAGDPVQFAAFSPEGDTLFVCARQEGSSPQYLALEVPSGRARWRLDELPFSASDAMGVSADGKRLAYADHEAIHFLDPASGVEIGTLPTEEGRTARHFVFSPDGKTLYTSAHRTALAWDVSFLP